VAKEEARQLPPLPLALREAKVLPGPGPDFQRAVAEVETLCKPLLKFEALLLQASVDDAASQTLVRGGAQLRSAALLWAPAAPDEIGAANTVASAGAAAAKAKSAADTAALLSVRAHVALPGFPHHIQHHCPIHFDRRTSPAEPLPHLQETIAAQPLFFVLKPSTLGALPAAAPAAASAAGPCASESHSHASNLLFV